MPITTTILSDKGYNYGMFEFAELPRAGDRIAVADVGGGAAVLDVLYILHNPVPVPPRQFAVQPAIATVIVHSQHAAGY